MKKEKKPEVELIPVKEEFDIFSALLDENNNNNVVLYDEKDQAVEFEQIAIVPIEENIYAILKPVTKVEGVEDDQAIVFKLVQENEEENLIVESDDKIVDQVFDVYYDLLEKAKNNK